jgi:hypothetical protein
MLLDWTTFKAFFISRSANPQYIETASKYFIYAFYGNVSCSCELSKSPSDTTDLNDWETNYKTISNSVVPQQQIAPFSSKKIATGGTIKSLFARNTGKRFNVVANTTTPCSYVSTYAWVKMTGVECIGGEIGDYAELKVFDTPAGTYSGVPNLLLNQFGYELNVAPDYYKRESPFDADVYQGMVLTIYYYSISDKQIGINYIMNEVKS